jgi:A/G-specific adenine glycosylase
VNRVISDLLVSWYERGHRDLPWRRTNDPYGIWISEIMLQQTRAQAVIPYYERFLARFPDAAALAAASEQEVLALWSGLGYYSRARNLRRAAFQIHATGGFPRDYESIRSLPGIGDYTAAAIASIAFGLPHAVLDGNVLRVVSRVENDSSDIASAATGARFRATAQSWLDPRRPGLFNQALMELGATVCLVRNPLCLLCPLTDLCRARAAGTVPQLPVKLGRKEPVRIEDTLFVAHERGRVLLRQIESSARRMAGFWELPTPLHLPQARALGELGHFRHSITHYRFVFRVVQSAAPRLRRSSAFRWVPLRELAEIPLSTTARKALRIAKIL